MAYEDWWQRIQAMFGGGAQPGSYGVMQSNQAPDINYGAAATGVDPGTGSYGVMAQTPQPDYGAIAMGSTGAPVSGGAGVGLGKLGKGLYDMGAQKDPLVPAPRFTPGHEG